MLSLFSSLSCFFFVCFALWAFKPLLVPRVRTYTRAAHIRTLLNPPGPLGSLLLARAAPNQRLVHAFGLTSTFVSGDIKTHKAFTTRAKALIAGVGDKEDRWRTITQSAEASAHRFLAQVQHPVAFATLVQCITLAVVLTILFDTDLETVRYDDLVYVTETINQRWKDSKTRDPATMHADDGLQCILAHLDRWVIDRERYPNPLNFILPAYETMWRVVAVTVGYVYRCRDNTLHDVVRAFGRDATEARFGACEGKEGTSMEAIVLEVLRLHPPTRHIARAPVERGWWRALVGPAVEVADVETVQMSEAYGANARVFDPMRFRASCGQAELFAFGYGRLKCIAAGWAPMAAGVIAAKVVLGIEEGGYVVTVGEKMGGRSGWEGWTVERT